MKQLKFAIIGCGRISYKHVQAVIDNRDAAELVGVCDLVPERAEARQAQYADAGFPAPAVFTDHLEMIRTLKPDVVTIATESGRHARIAMQAMREGVHVIVEKPMALSTSDAGAMQRCAGECGVKLAVVHQNRFNPPVQLMRRALEEGRFGKLVSGSIRILWNRNMEYYRQAPWRGTWAEDGGTLMNQCIHGIDLLQWMMGGQVDTVYAQTGTFLRDIEAEDFGAILIRFKNGAIGTVEGSACVYPKNLSETLSLFGESGAVVIGGLAVNHIDTWRFADERDYDAAASEANTEIDSVYGKGHGPYFRNVINAIREGTPLLIDAYEGEKAMKIILAAYQSQKTGLPVSFDRVNFSTLDMVK